MILLCDRLINEGLIEKQPTSTDKNKIPDKKNKQIKHPTAREQALIHCYKGLPVIQKGQPLYDDYITLATPRKRITYPSDSWNKAKSLIASIEFILPSLSESEKQQAEDEINTIRGNFSH